MVAAPSCEDFIVLAHSRISSENEYAKINSHIDPDYGGIFSRNVLE